MEDENEEIKIIKKDQCCLNTVYNIIFLSKK